MLSLVLGEVSREADVGPRVFPIDVRPFVVKVHDCLCDLRSDVGIRQMRPCSSYNRVVFLNLIADLPGRTCRGCGRWIPHRGHAMTGASRVCVRRPRQHATSLRSARMFAQKSDSRRGKVRLPKAIQGLATTGELKWFHATVDVLSSHRVFRITTPIAQRRATCTPARYRRKSASDLICDGGFLIILHAPTYTLHTKLRRTMAPSQ